ncbi:hypothetical protein [Vibrio barjaei]|uniref:hypothetical protein n=1 Tax=Vibrio barjaei TaxID=1676683 RepID=UPI00228418F7|nr:hypothetical protein [Vibrio barjaei]MCY9874063.1 hypothetical protein [Vibrio barjaei]
MTVNVCGIGKAGITLSVNGKNEFIRKAKYLCRRDDPASDKVQAKFEAKNQKSFSLFMLDPEGPTQEGIQVYRSDDSTCFLDDHNLGQKQPIIGIVVEGSKGLYVETCVEKLELIRREREFAQMRVGTRHIGRFGNDDKAYKQHLEYIDKENGGMFTRAYHPF